MITKTIMTLGIIAGFVIGISFSSVYAGIPWSTSEIADNAITTEKIKNKQVKTADIKNNAVKSNKIKDGEVKSADLAVNSVGTSAIATNAVGGSEIAGTSKLIFGSCTFNPTSRDSNEKWTEPCDANGSEIGDEVIATQNDEEQCFPVSFAKVISPNKIHLQVTNLCNFTVDPGDVRVSFIIFKTS